MIKLIVVIDLLVALLNVALFLNIVHESLELFKKRHPDISKLNHIYKPSTFVYMILILLALIPIINIICAWIWIAYQDQMVRDIVTKIEAECDL